MARSVYSVSWSDGNTNVIAGLDPAIHHFLKKMDARIKSAHDEGGKRKTPAAGVRKRGPVDSCVTITRRRA